MANRRTSKKAERIRRSTAWTCLQAIEALVSEAWHRQQMYDVDLDLDEAQVLVALNARLAEEDSDALADVETLVTEACHRQQMHEVDLNLDEAQIFSDFDAQLKEGDSDAPTAVETLVTELCQQQQMYEYNFDFQEMQIFSLLEALLGDIDGTDPVGAMSRLTMASLSGRASDSWESSSPETVVNCGLQSQRAPPVSGINRLSIS